MTASWNSFLLILSLKILQQPASEKVKYAVWAFWVFFLVSNFIFPTIPSWYKHKVRTLTYIFRIWNSAMADLTHCFILAFYLHLFLCFFLLVHLTPSTNMLSSVPHRRQKQFCFHWCFWHPTRGDWGGCEGCRWDFHGDRSIRRRHKQHNPSLWSGMYTWMDSSRTLFQLTRATSAKESFSQGSANSCDGSDDSCVVAFLMIRHEGAQSLPHLSHLRLLMSAQGLLKVAVLLLGGVLLSLYFQEFEIIALYSLFFFWKEKLGGTVEARW